MHITHVTALAVCSAEAEQPSQQLQNCEANTKLFIPPEELLDITLQSKGSLISRENIIPEGCTGKVWVMFCRRSLQKPDPAYEKRPYQDPDPGSNILELHMNF